MADRYVPEDIVSRIISKLPAKPLLQFRCVSKHWNRLISDPNFMKLRSRRMMFFSVYPFDHAYAIDNNFPECDNANSILELRYPVEGKYVKVVGTVNGVLLLVVFKHGCHDMILYNPLTAAIMNVPDPPAHCSSTEHDVVYGFGYGITPDDLKIVIISQTKRCDLRYCDVFSFKTKSWNKALELIGNYIHFGCGYNGVFVNGFLYWDVNMADENRTYAERALVALDVRGMVFSEIRHSLRISQYPLGTLKGQLCMICSGRRGGSLELWVMHGHGVRTSFSKICQLTSLKAYLKPMSPRMNAFRTMCILDDGKLVLIFTHELIIYDMLNDSYKRVITEANQAWCGYEAIEYVESFTSPSLSV